MFSDLGLKCKISPVCLLDLVTHFFCSILRFSFVFRSSVGEWTVHFFGMPRTAIIMGWLLSHSQAAPSEMPLDTSPVRVIMGWQGPHSQAAPSEMPLYTSPVRVIMGRPLSHSQAAPSDMPANPLTAEHCQSLYVNQNPKQKFWRTFKLPWGENLHASNHPSQRPSWTHPPARRNVDQRLLRRSQSVLIPVIGIREERLKMKFWFSLFSCHCYSQFCYVRLQRTPAAITCASSLQLIT